MEEKFNIHTIKEINTSSRGCCVVHSTDNTEKVNQLRCCKLSSFNWLEDYSDPVENEELYVEVRFKNDHKEFFKHSPDLLLSEGDIVAVEAQSGHDIGIVALTGDAVRLQMKRKHFDFEKNEIKKVYRYARPVDISNWLKAISLENDAIFKSREMLKTDFQRRRNPV